MNITRMHHVRSTRVRLLVIINIGRVVLVFTQSITHDLLMAVADVSIAEISIRIQIAMMYFIMVSARKSLATPKFLRAGLVKSPLLLFAR
jgi:low temperature requirement protein LtrA